MKYGTVYNTLAAGTALTGEIRHGPVAPGED
jgi:hypothetical protein